MQDELKIVPECAETDRQVLSSPDGMVDRVFSDRILSRESAEDVLELNEEVDIQAEGEGQQ
jgi:hypothetical protein